jgi:hypothetical protein
MLMYLQKEIRGKNLQKDPDPYYSVRIQRSESGSKSKCHGSGTLLRKNFFRQMYAFPTGSVADPDPGSGIGCFLTPGSGIRNRFFPDPGSRISDPGSQDHIFKSFLTIFLVKKFFNSLKIGPNFFLQHFKAKIIYNFVKFVV